MFGAYVTCHQRTFASAVGVPVLFVPTAKTYDATPDSGSCDGFHCAVIEEIDCACATSAVGADGGVVSVASALSLVEVADSVPATARAAAEVRGERVGKRSSTRETANRARFSGFDGRTMGAFDCAMGRARNGAWSGVALAFAALACAGFENTRSAATMTAAVNDASMLPILGRRFPRVRARSCRAVRNVRH
jgi:hypothetical protein